MSGTNLPREVLRWVQSLDLAYSVKNVRRDFSNGFLVAEIISRYYSKDISMHSFDNGDAAKRKRDNWSQLLKVFRKLRLSHLITENQCNLIACLEGDAAVEFLSRLYEELTRRKLQTQVKKATVGRVAGYAREIVVNKIRKAHDINNVGEESDERDIARVGSMVISEHEASLQDDRQANPSRFSTASTAHIGMRSAPGPPKSVNDAGNDENMPQVRVKEIQVKQLDRNVTHLRASRQVSGMSSPGARGGSQERNTRSVSPGGNEHGGFTQEASIVSASQVQMGGGGGALLPENAVSTLNTCLVRVLGSECHPHWSNSVDAYQNLMSITNLPWNSDYDRLLANALNEVRTSARSLADTCINGVAHFWKVSDLLCQFITAAPVGSFSFSMARDAFEALGNRLSQIGPADSLTLFVDFSLFKLTNTINRNSNKRVGILRILNAFTPPDSQSRMSCLRKLQSTLTDMSVFIHCLTILAQHETRMDRYLLDLYLYYANIGLDLPSPKLRAGAIAILAILVTHSNTIIAGLVPQLLQSAKTETWWEVQAQLLSVCGGIFEAQDRERDNNNDVEVSEDSIAMLSFAQEVIEIVFNAEASRNVKLWGIQNLVVGTRLSLETTIGFDFTGTFCHVLSSLNNIDRDVLLGFGGMGGGLSNSQELEQGSTASLPTSTGAATDIIPVVSQWKPIAIARALERIVVESEVENMSTAQLTVLHACLSSAVSAAIDRDAPSENALVGGWVDVYQSLHSHIFKAIGNAESLDSATGILSSYLFSCSQIHESILVDTKLAAVVRNIYTDIKAEAVRNGFEHFLRDVAASGFPFDQLASAFMTNFAKNSAAVFEKSLALQKLSKDINRN